MSHPARGAEYALFPSFGVDLDERPHPERGLWQAFAHTDFDPHRDGPVRLAQTGDGLLQVANPASTA